MFSGVQRAIVFGVTAVLGVAMLAGCDGSSTGSSTGTARTPAATPAAPAALTWSRGTVLELQDQMPEGFFPFDWQLSGGATADQAEETFTSALEQSHPTLAVGTALASWLRTPDRALARARVDRIIKEWHLTRPGSRADYGFPYSVGDQTLEPGWYSGMSDWTLPLLLVGVWQETGVQRYKRLADRLIELASRPVSEGGTLWFEDGNCWISEYAWDGMTVDQESFVMNGNQFALAAMGVLASTTEDPDLQDLFGQCSQGIFDRSTDYRVDDAWPLYMLNPASVDTRDYVIFEILTFDALARISGDDRFTAEAQWRRDTMRDTHPVTFTEGAGAELVFPLIGPPHPYEFDMYTVEIECSDGTSQVAFSATNSMDYSRPLGERAFARASAADLDPEKTRCEVASNNGRVRVQLFEGPVVRAAGSPAADASISFEVTPFNLQEDVAGAFTMDPPADKTSEDYLDLQSRLTFTPEKPISVSRDTIFGVTTRVGAGVPLSVLLTSGERTCHRNYPLLRPRVDNAVLLSSIGFAECADLKTVDSVTLIFYRSDLKRSVSVTPGELVVFEDPAQLASWVDGNDPYLPH